MTQAVIPLPSVSDDRPWIYDDGETTVYRASSMGACLKSLVAARRGYTRMPMRQFFADIAAEGDLHEQTILAKLSDLYDFNVAKSHTLDGQELLELEVGPNTIIRCHPDGIAQSRSGARVAVLEAKSMSKDVWETFHRKKFDAEPRYAWQVSVEMAASNLPLIFGYKNRNNGRIEHFRLEDAPVALNDLKKRVAKVESLARKDDLEITDIPCDANSLLCLSYAYLHGGESKAAAELPPDFDITRLDLLAETYDRAREREKVAKAAKSDTRDLIAEILDEKKVEDVSGPRFHVYWSASKRSGLDKDLLDMKLEFFKEALALANSMILSGEKHTDQSTTLIGQALEDLMTGASLFYAEKEVRALQVKAVKGAS